MGRKNKNKVIFEKEIVTKEVAQKLLAEQEITDQANNKESTTHSAGEIKEGKDPKSIVVEIGDKSKKKKKKRKHPHQVENAEAPETKKQKQEVPSADDQDINITSENAATENDNSEKVEIKREESIRAMKRKKHAELLQEKMLKAELATQQKCLNYVSQWKHNRNQWKFEKLKQVWLKKYMFNSNKVPAEMWNTLLEYFSGCKGKARESVIQDALKVIDAENEDEEDGVKLQRARDIIQHLQE